MNLISLSINLALINFETWQNSVCVWELVPHAQLRWLL